MQPELSPEQLAPELIGTGAQAIVDNAQRLGLKWQLRLATVNTSAGPTATYDGDTEPIEMTSMIGAVFLAQRVYVIQVPPSGNFIVGSTYVPPLGISTIATSGVNSGGTEVVYTAGQWTYEHTYVLPNNRNFKYEWLGMSFNLSGGVDSQDTVRLRKGSATTSGTLLDTVVHGIDSTATTPQNFYQSGFFKNTSGATVMTKLSVTHQRTAGAAIINMANLAGSGKGQLIVYDFSSTTDQPDLAAQLVSV